MSTIYGWFPKRMIVAEPDLRRRLSKDSWRVASSANRHYHGLGKREIAIFRALRSPNSIEHS